MALDTVTTLDASSVSRKIAAILVETDKYVQAAAAVDSTGAPITSANPANVTLATTLDSANDSIRLAYPAAQVYKSYNSTSSLGAGSAATVWDPASGKAIYVSFCTISVYGTTGGRIFLFFSAAADQTYTAGTDQPLFVGSFAPSATVKPGVHLTFPVPYAAANADYNLMYQNDAAISIDITLAGYEI